MACMRCGGTGVLPNFELCSCEAGIRLAKRRLQNKENNSSLPSYIPEGYGCEFEGALLNGDLGDKIGDWMDNLHKSIINAKNFDKNYFIYLPMRSGKSYFMYSIYAKLDKYGICEPPRNIVSLNEVLKADTFSKREELSRIRTAPIFFIYLEDVLPVYLIQTINTILSIRLEVNNKLIILSSTPWDTICKLFTKIKRLEGNGLLKTFSVKECE